ncbi:hypothetical protein DYB32_005730 [Aphanomyces invadans]|uniref:PHD-type domain-containing protein n=1 Tax=Aphanomyces invadans TaxID=157072 RepID=A0A418ATP7_9STRA|nr:hypothetical protein DYB32_005730 [Aphanomyces invadans]
MASTSCVQVSCRFRGSPDIDTEAAAAPWLDFPDPHTVLMSHAKGHASRHSSFARVFSGEATQDQVFEHVGAPVVNDLLLGYNYTVLAYGQTGSGKTHTIVGSKTDPGILPRLVQRVFDMISELETLSTIRFGSRAQHIQNAPHVNAEKNVSEYKQLLAEMERKVEALSQYVAQLSNSSAAGPTTCDRCRQQMNSPASDPPEQSQAASSSSPSAPHDDEAPPLCAVCHIASNDLILCDGNCGLFWHRACVTEPVRNDDNIDENHLEFYCPSCQHGIATDPGKAVQHEITCLKQALHLMKQERDEAAERANIDKHVYEFADLKKTDVHRYDSPTES